MSVHQIERYYIHVDLSDCTKEKREKIRVLLIKNDIHNAKFIDTDLNIGDFDRRLSAALIDGMINDILNG